VSGLAGLNVPLATPAGTTLFEAMERARATWTDERLDDLARRVDDGFNRVDEDLRSLRTELSGRIGGLEGRIDALQRTMIQVGGGMTVAILATLVSVVLTRA
jgi:hypothetical protein